MHGQTALHSSAHAAVARHAMPQRNQCLLTDAGAGGGVDVPGSVAPRQRAQHARLIEVAQPDEVLSSKENIEFAWSLHAAIRCFVMGMHASIACRCLHAASRNYAGIQPPAVAAGMQRGASARARVTRHTAQLAGGSCTTASAAVRARARAIARDSNRDLTATCCRQLPPAPARRRRRRRAAPRLTGRRQLPLLRAAARCKRRRPRRRPRPRPPASCMRQPPLAVAATPVPRHAGGGAARQPQRAPALAAPSVHLRRCSRSGATRRARALCASRRRCAGACQPSSKSAPTN